MSTDNSEDNNNRLEEISEKSPEETEGLTDINDNTETKKKFVKNKKTLVGILTVIFIFIIAGGVALAYPHFGKKYVQETADSTNSTKNKLESKLETDKKSTLDKKIALDKKTNSDKPAINLDDYLGYWDINGSENKELSIYNTKDGKVKFALWYLRLYSVGDIDFTPVENTADFSIQENGQKMKGTLTFQETSIIVNITESSYPYMPVEKMIFDNRHSQSWGGYGLTDKESIGVSSDTSDSTDNCNNCGVKLHSEEEKGWGYCNSCAGGFICHFCFTKLSAQEKEWGYCHTCVEFFRCTVCHEIKLNDCIDGICSECAPKCLSCGIAEWGGIVLEDGYCNSCRAAFTCMVCQQFKSNDVFFRGVCSDCVDPTCIICGAQGDIGFIDGYCEFCYESLFGNGS